MKYKAIFYTSLLLILTLVLKLANCSAGETGRISHDTLTKANISQIAINEVKKRDHWDSLKVSYLERRKDVWYVMIIRLPETPGGHRTLLITFDGKITEYLGGR